MKDEEIKVRVEWPSTSQPGRTLVETWRFDPDIHCFNCGSKGLWEDTCDDYYAGPGYWCLKCSSICHGHASQVTEKDAFQFEHLNALKRSVK